MYFLEVEGALNSPVIIVICKQVGSNPRGIILKEQGVIYLVTNTKIVQTRVKLSLIRKWLDVIFMKP